MSDAAKEVAGFWVRLASTMIDGLLLGLTILMLNSLIISSVHSWFSTADLLRLSLWALLLLSIPGTVLYLGWFNAEGRQTLGKKIFGLVVVSTSFQPVSLWQSLKRAGIFWLDSLFGGLGHLWMLVNSRKQAIHDVLTKTLVVRTRKSRPFEVGLIILTLLLGAAAMDLLFSAFRSNFVQAFRIPTGSVKPTLLIGDFIIADKLWARKYAPMRGDMIVFKYPKDENLDYIERCVAVPGDIVHIRKGLLHVNDKVESLSALGRYFDPHERRSVTEYEVLWPEGRRYRIRYYADLATEDYGPIIVPPDHYFVMGDNRDNAADSRVWGFVPRENITGKAGLIYWSWDSNTSSVRWSRIGMAIE